MTRPSRTVLLLSCAVVAVSTACATRIAREDWGAITPDASIHVTTLAGERVELTDVTVFADALDGVRTDFSARVAIPLDSIDFIETRSDAALPVLAAIAVIGATVWIVQAMGQSNTRPAPTEILNSCPFLYSFDGTEYRLDSETFAGAITRGVQRTDVDNLDHLRPVDGVYRLRLTNERPETQYTDEVVLLAVDHPDGTEVYPDAAGAVHAFADGRAPRRATGVRGDDALLEVEAWDDRFWTGDPLETADAEIDTELRDGLVLTFDHPGTERALLAVRTRNTELAPYALQTILSLQGDGLVDWYRQVDRDAGLQQRLKSWVLREGTLHVSVWRDGEWQRQDALPDVGPHLAKAQVARLDLGGVEGEEVRVRIDGARGLWMIDWLALGTEPSAPLGVTPLEPLTASGSDGRDLRTTLSSVDDAYLTSLEGYDVELTYAAPPEPGPGTTRSVLARSTGFYHIYTDQSGPSRAQVVDRILAEPLFGNRFVLERLRSAKAEADAAGR